MTQTFVDEGSSNLRFGLANICLAEEELPIQIRDINRVHVNDVNILARNPSPGFSGFWAVSHYCRGASKDP